MLTEQLCHDELEHAQALLDDDSVVALAETFRMLGDITRVRILDAISRSELLRLRHRRAARAERIGRVPPAAAAARHASGAAAPRRPQIFYTLDDHHIVRLFEQGLEHVQESAPLPRCDGGASAKRHEHRTCTVCELHAESTFKVEGMDCREEVVLIERRFKNLPGLEDFSAPTHGPAPAREVRRGEAVGRRRSPAAVADAGMRAWLEHEEPIATGDPRAARRRSHPAADPARLLAAGLLAATRRRARWLGVVCSRCRLRSGVPPTGAQGLARAAPRARSTSTCSCSSPSPGAIAARRVVRGRVRGLPVRRRAGARSAHPRARAERGPRADGSGARRGAGARRRGERGSPVDRIAPGAIIVVKPGEKMPLDGEVLAGTSRVNQAPVTGESLPVDKAPGDEVFAGTINGRGALDVRVTRRRRDTTLARIIHLVEQAQAQRAPSQTFVERFARVYTPAVHRAGGGRRRRAAARWSAAPGTSGSIARWCCSSCRARARSSSPRRCRLWRRSPARRARACSSRGARTSSARAACAAWLSTRPAR